MPGVVERLQGPSVNVCYTVEWHPESIQVQVVVVRETDLAALEARVSELEEFEAAIERAWEWAIGTSRRNATYIIGNKLRRAVREALESRHSCVVRPRA